jgi:ATP-dependent RNA helicase DeaD
VIHVEIPRDAETLQHRSGRTGRAGKKGTAVLVVPFPRRRRVEMMLRSARIEAEWGQAPSLETIREADRQRLLDRLLVTPDAEDDADDLAIAQELLAKQSAEQIALALVRAHRASLPQPEELVASAPERIATQHHRAGFEDTVWFRMDIGRRQNADPRWVLPLLCRRGHVTRSEIGAIRIGMNESFVQIPNAIAARFADAVRRTANPDSDDEGSIAIEQSEAPREAARQHRKGNDGPSHHGGQNYAQNQGADQARKPYKPRTLTPRDNQDGPRGPRGPRPVRDVNFKGKPKGPRRKD